MDIEPPESTTAVVATSTAVVGTGAALGAATMHTLAAMRRQASGKSQVDFLRDPASFEGGVLGMLAAGFGGVLVDQFSPRWEKLGKAVALIGVGTITVGALVGASKAALAQAPAPPQLPAGPPPAMPAVYTADETRSGSTLNMRVGDRLVVSLPASLPTAKWQWAASNAAAIAYEGPQSTTDAAGNTTENDSFVAKAAGSTILQAELVASGNVSATFTVTLNVT